jgi:hypothetical protein
MQINPIRVFTWGGLDQIAPPDSDYFVKLALAERFLLIVTVHVEVRLVQAPLQLEKARPGGGVATSVTLVPAG